MTMHKALHPRNGVEKLYVSWKEGVRGLANIQNSVNASIQLSEDYIKKGQRKTDHGNQKQYRQHQYGNQKQYRQHQYQRKKKRRSKNRKQKREKKNKPNCVDISSANKRHLTWENLDMVKKEKP